MLFSCCKAAASSDTPFLERLIAHWSNHFTVSIARREVLGLAGNDTLSAGASEDVNPDVLQPGDVCRVLPGEAVPRGGDAAPPCLNCRRSRPT